MKHKVYRPLLGLFILSMVVACKKPTSESGENKDPKYDGYVPTVEGSTIGNAVEKLSASDIFRTRIYGGVINNLVSTSAGWTNRNDTRTVTLTYSYRFGKSFATPAKRNTSGADTEKQRVGVS